jgi:hypothetical protein
MSAPTFEEGSGGTDRGRALQGTRESGPIFMSKGVNNVIL